MISSKQSIPEILLYNPELRVVFDRYEAWEKHLDVPLKKINREIFSNNEFLVEVLRAFDKPHRFCPTRFLKFPIHLVLDYLYKTHRYYSYKRMLEIEQTTSQLALTYGTTHPLLLILNSFFPNYRKRLEEHMEMEEDTLFPYVIDLEERVKYKGKVPDSIFSHYSLDEFIHSHEEEELDEQLGEIRKLIQHRFPELQQVFLFEVLRKQLDYFQRDLHIHEQIEDHVLVAQARKLELRLAK